MDPAVSPRTMAFLEAVLERARRRADRAEVYYVEGLNRPVVFEAGRVKEALARQSAGVALRLFAGGRAGLTSTTRLEDPDALVERALAVAPFGPAADHPLPGPAGVAPVPAYDEGVATLPPERMAEMGGAVLERLREAAPDAVWEGRVSCTVGTTLLMNTEGLLAVHRRTSFHVGFAGTLVQDGDMVFVGESLASARRVEDLSGLVASLLEQLEPARRVVPAPTGEVPVVFTPRGFVGLLLEPLLTGLNGRAVQQGISPLVHRLGEEVVDARISLWDDPTQPYLPGSTPVDDEGVPTRRVPLLERGRVAGFLHDLQSAARLGMEPTGSALRSLASFPRPGARALTLEPGETPLQDLLEGLPVALLVEEPLGAGQGNVLGGDFSANVLLGYRLERGERVGRVKNTMVAGNVYAALRRLRGLSREARWVDGFCFAPTLVCEGVSVSTRS